MANFPLLGLAFPRRPDVASGTERSHLAGIASVAGGSHHGAARQIFIQRPTGRAGIAFTNYKLQISTALSTRHE